MASRGLGVNLSLGLIMFVSHHDNRPYDVVRSCCWDWAIAIHQRSQQVKHQTRGGAENPGFQTPTAYRFFRALCATTSPTRWVMLALKVSAPGLAGAKRSSFQRFRPADHARQRWLGMRGILRMRPHPWPRGHGHERVIHHSRWVDRGRPSASAKYCSSKYLRDAIDEIRPE